MAASRSPGFAYELLKYGPPPLPVCGVGKDKQIDVHGSLFDLPGARTGLYFKELVQLTRELNAVFRRQARSMLRETQKRYGDKSIQITIALWKGGLYLTYARPARRRKRAR